MVRPLPILLILALFAIPKRGVEPTARRGMSVEEGQRFWSFVTPESHPSPQVRGDSWSKGDIDRFVYAKRRAAGLGSVGDADPRTLIRRVYFDLVGLPPSAEDVDAFLEESAATPQAAYERLVDRLLASPHFGERWGRHWLDAARYADSNGRDRNMIWYHAWRYRDYVIASFNADKPFDRFVRQQIAGDLLPDATDETRVATGFLALGPKAFEEIKPDVFRMDLIDEQIDVIGRSVLGLSVGCARCHDHKFDPIPTKDYYALAGILLSTEMLYGYGPTGIKATAHSHSALIPIGPKAADHGPAGLAYLAEIDRLTLNQNMARSDRYRIVRRVADAKIQLGKPGADREALAKDIERMEAEVREWDVKVKASEAALQEAFDRPPPQPGWAMGARDPAEPKDCRVHVRGETTNLGDAVPRGVLKVFPNSVASIPNSQSGRLQLADWLADHRNPLTARVHVNRVWQHLFGRGLVTTPDDFGVNGARPSHPELLDDLAVRLMDGGWSTKKLIRSIMLSRTYRQASGHDPASYEKDPDNALLWRMAPKRLEAEVLRDAILSVSGQLDLRPPAPEATFLAKLHPGRENEYRTFKPVLTAEQIEHPYRSVYLPVIRGVLPPVFSLFDFASPDRPVAQRNESTVPAQSLFLMNNPWMIAQSRHLAERLLKVEEPRRLDTLYLLAFSRPPTVDERAMAESYLQGDAGERWVSYSQAILASAEYRYVR